MLKGGNASEAYRYAYRCENMKDATIRNKASDLLKKGDIRVMLNELKEDAQERAQLTVEDLIAELEENRQAALRAETVQSSAATAATMGKAKLLGLDKQIIDHTSSDGSKFLRRSQVRRFIQAFSGKITKGQNCPLEENQPVGEAV